MTWTVIIAVVIGIILKFAMSPPSAIVGWVLSKFALHPKLESKDIAIAYNGKHLGEEEKKRFTNHFNEAIYLNKHYIFPGHEELFLHPDTKVIPFIINEKGEKRKRTIFVYLYEDYVDVVKQSKKKVVSYRLRADQLQNFNRSAEAIGVNII